MMGNSVLATVEQPDERERDVFSIGWGILVSWESVYLGQVNSDEEDLLVLAKDKLSVVSSAVFANLLSRKSL